MIGAQNKTGEPDNNCGPKKWNKANNEQFWE